jgi:hypothetical protein
MLIVSWIRRRQMAANVALAIRLSRNRKIRHRFANKAEAMENPSPISRICGFA